MSKLFCQACWSANITNCKTYMAELNEINNIEHDWLMQIPVVYWAKNHFTTYIKSNHVTNNMTESFNI